MTSRLSVMNWATACHTGAHPAAVVCGSTLPGASVSGPSSTSSDAPGVAIGTRSRPAAGARVDGRLELILERTPEDLGSEKWIDQTELPQHRRARGHEYATAIQPQFGVEPAAQLDQGASDHLGRILGDGFGACGGVAERLANEQIAGATSILGQVGKAPGRKSKNWQDEKCDEHRRELRAIARAQRREQRRQACPPAFGDDESEQPHASQERHVEAHDENAANQE